jgi:hypothetical protein
MGIRSLASHATRVAALIVIGVVTAHAAAEKLVTKKEIGGKVTIQVPKSFKMMSAAMLAAKYAPETRPTVAYSDDRGTVNIALSLTAQALSPDQVPTMYRTLEQQFRTAFPTAKWHESKLYERDGTRFFMLDLTMPAADTQIRNTIVGTSVQGKLFLATFNVTKDLEEQWLPTGQKVLDTLKIKK